MTEKDLKAAWFGYGSIGGFVAGFACCLLAFWWVLAQA